MWGNIKEVVTTISAVIALAVTLGTPLVWLVRKYNKTLKDFTKLITDQGKINLDQWEEIQEIKEDVDKLEDEMINVTVCLEQNTAEHLAIEQNLDGLRQGLLVIIQIELDKLLCRCIQADHRTMRDSERADALYAAYVALKGNHGMNRTKADFDALPLK